MDIEFAVKNFIKKLRLFIDGILISSSKKYTPAKQAIRCTRNLHRAVWNSVCFGYSELSNVLPRDIKCEFFAKGTEKCKIFDSLLDKFVEIFNDHGRPKIESVVDEKMWFCSSYPFRHKTTLHCSERQVKLFGKGLMQHLRL